MGGASSPGNSAVPEPAWRALRSLDPQLEDQILTLATCLALAEQRFQMLFEEVLPRFAETPDDLTGKADVLADAHHDDNGQHRTTITPELVETMGLEPTTPGLQSRSDPDS